MPLPVDFEEKVKLPPAQNGGYPYSIKAEDLMDNFKYCALEADINFTDEVQLIIEPQSDGTRTIRAKLYLPESQSFPGGGNLNMRVDSVFLSLGTNDMITTGGTTTDCWRNGVYVGRFPIGSEPPHEGTLEYYASTYVSGC